MLVLEANDDITAVESNGNSLHMAKISFKGVNFVRSAVENFDFGKVDSLIVDPPRSGLSVKLKELIILNGVNRIVYVSCSTATLARDLKFFKSEGFSIKKMTMLDMFPNTSHIETITLLLRN